MTDNIQYWRDFYSRSPERVPLDPSPFAVDVAKSLTAPQAILDIGCGNGRDSLYFASQGHEVIAVDGAEAATEFVVAQASAHGFTNLVATDCRVEELSSNTRIADLVGHVRTKDQPVAVYARFFLHAITESEQIDLLTWASNVLRPGETAHLEYRAEDLDEAQYVFGSHYRRPIAVPELHLQVESLGFDVLREEISDTFAVHATERPLVGRTTISRKYE